MSESALILGFPEYAPQGRRLAAAVGLDYREVELHRFPDGECRVRLPIPLPEQVVFCRSLNDPNDKLIELALAARTARALGARHLTLVAPYLCYMRQDVAFSPGEAISQRIVGRLLADWFDALITVDPHLHRIAVLDEAVPATVALALASAPLIGALLARESPPPLLAGPDAESAQWVSAIAEAVGLDWCVGEKERLGDREVRVHFPPADCRGRPVVLVDDVASTGCTLEAAALALAQEQPEGVSVLVTHALFLDGALGRLKAAGVGRVLSTDSIPHPTNAIELAPLLARALAG